VTFGFGFALGVAASEVAGIDMRTAAHNATCRIRRLEIMEPTIRGGSNTQG